MPFYFAGPFGIQCLAAARVHFIPNGRNTVESEKLRVDLRGVNLGKLKAFADVTIPSAIGDLMILGFRVIHEDGKHPWVGFPSNSYPKDGKIVNKRLLDVSGAAKRAIADAVLREYENGPDRS